MPSGGDWIAIDKSLYSKREREREREREVCKITHILKQNRCNDFKNAYRSNMHV